MDNELRQRIRNSETGNTKRVIGRIIQKLEDYDARYQHLLNLQNVDVENLYFKDKERKIDFIFVYDYGNKKNNKEKVNAFIANLEIEGLEFEGERSEVRSELLFIKVHAPTNILIRLAYVHNIEPACEKIEDYRIKKGFHPKCMENELTSPNVNSKVYNRAKESVSGTKPRSITSAERIMIIYELLKTTKYGNAAHEFGLISLLERNFLQSAYPMHDGGYTWTETGPLNDRQLLNKYWGSFSCLFKVQPIQLIQKYYGPEMAFYFAFFGFYNEMLIYATLIGFISFIYGLFTFNTSYNYYSGDICNSEYILCPSCPYNGICRFDRIKNYCLESKMTYIFDNVGTFCYAIIMCFWATLTLERWKRKQAVLTYKWNLAYLEDDVTVRPDYPLRTKYRRESKFTSGLDPYTPTRVRVWKLMISCSVILLLIIMQVTMVVVIIVMRLLLKYQIFKARHSKFLRNHNGIISAIVSNTAGLIFMVIFEWIFMKVAKKLTDYENPRTQMEYDKSYLYKLFILCFINAYSILYYTSFFKGRFNTYPGDESQYKGIGILNIDVCAQSGCVLDVCLQLVIILVGKSLAKSSWEYIKPLLAIYYKLFKRRVKVKENLPLWEKSYYEKSVEQYFLFFEFRDIILQYGYITLFTAAFPLAPLLALIYNTIELRLDAYKLVRFHRRPVPIRIYGIGPWNNILQTVTIIGAVTNAFLIAFTTHFVPFIINIEGYQTRKVEKYMKRTFSKFRVLDFGESVDQELKNTTFGDICYYQGSRYPPETPLAYTLTGYFWYEVSIRFLTVLIITCFVLCFTGLLAFAIPDIPRSIQERINYKKRMDAEIREEHMTKSIQRQVKSKN